MAKPDKPYRHRSIGNHALHPETLMMSYGYEPQLSEGSVKCPLFQTSTFVFERAADGKAFFEVAYGLREKRRGRGAGADLLAHQQPRPRDPRGPARPVGRRGSDARCSRAAWRRSRPRLWTFLRPGDVLVHSEPLYGGTEFLVHNILPQFGITPAGFRAGAGRAHARARRSQAAKKQGRIAVIYPRDARQSDQRPGRHRSLRRGRGPARHGRQPAPAGDRRQHLPRPALAAAADAGRGPRDLLADQVRRRPQRRDRRRLPRQRGAISPACAACARSSAHVATRTPAGS